MVNCESLYSKFDRGNRVYAKTKKKKTLEELEIIPICSKKRVCEKIVLEEFSKFKYCKFNLKLFHDSI